MPLDFPSSPTVGQQHTSGVQTWEWDGVSWNIIPTTAGGGGEASIFVGPDAPVGPDDGDLWWDTDEPDLLNSMVDPAAIVADAIFLASLQANATYNAYLDGKYAPIGVWTSYTPTISGAGWAVGNGSVVGRYFVTAAKKVRLKGRLLLGSTSTIGGSQLLATLPVALPAAVGATYSSGLVVVSAATVNIAVCTILGSGTNIAFFGMISGTNGQLSSFVQNSPVALASGHSLSWDIEYEAA